MSPIQQMLLGVGAVATKTYVDDIFSTFVYAGTGANRSINNGIDMSSSGGGLTWIKKRTGSESHYLFDTERGSGKYLQSNGTNAEGTNNDYLSAFNNNGFSLGDYNDVNGSGQDYASWTFRKASGFFDVVTYTGNSTAGRQVSHNLGSIPGLMIVKCTSSAGEPWYVYHKDLGATKHLKLDTTSASSTSSEPWNNTEPTSTHFTLAQYNSSNGSGKTYVAYLFAGGESTAATARSVDFDGTGDTLEIPNSSDYSFGSGDFTIEGWYKPDSISTDTFASVWNYGVNRRSWSVQASSNGKVRFNVSSNGSNNTASEGGNLYIGQWAHFAAVRDGNTLRLFVNGLQVATSSFTGSVYDNTNDNLFIGSTHGTANLADGEISNLRIVKGTAVYTSSFKPPTAPLTSITNTKLLCCNNSSTTGSTTTSGTITANGNPTASTDSPFDDPAAHVFGESGSESVIKCGSYVGNANNDGPEINLGWEPSFILLKPAESAENWGMWDSMRGIVTGGNDMRFLPNGNHAEITNFDGLSLTPTGFKITSLNALINPSGEKVVYIAIRRADGYVGKPPELGTGVFAMDMGVGSSSDPAFLSGFPVDFVIYTEPAGGSAKSVGTRLLGSKKVVASSSDDQANDTKAMWDSNGGYGINRNYDFIAWMWKRHAGFDVVAYEGNSTNRQIRHSMGIAPTMVWLKSRTSTEGWVVGSSGLSSWAEYLTLNNTDAESTNAGIFDSTAPTATAFSLGSQNRSNENNNNYIAMLFASVDGISKVGYYDGTSSSNTITTGFQPRFVMIKSTTDSTEGWYILDTVRGWASGNDKYILLNSNAAEGLLDVGAPTSTGFTITSSSGGFNSSGEKYIYYCHA